MEMSQSEELTRQAEIVNIILKDIEPSHKAIVLTCLEICYMTGKIEALEKLRLC